MELRIQRACSVISAGMVPLHTIAAILLTISGTTLAEDFGEDATPPKLPAPLLTLITQAAELPHCSIEYWRRHDAGIHGVRNRKARFLLQLPCWRLDEWAENGSHIQTLCFDGRRYYYHRPGAPHLVVTSNAFILRREISAASSPHPLIGILAMPFSHPEAYHKCKFPEVADPLEIEKALGDFTVEEIEGSDESNELRFQISGPHLHWRITFSEDNAGRVRVVEENFQHRQDPESTEIRPAMMLDGNSRYVCQRVFQDWQTFSLDGHDIELPGTIDLRSRDLSDGGQLVNGAAEQGTLIPGSVEHLSPPLPKERFQVPLGLVPKPVIID